MFFTDRRKMFRNDVMFLQVDDLTFVTEVSSF